MQTRSSPRYLMAKATPGGQRDVAADDRVAAEEALLGVEEVHRAALALASSRSPCPAARPSPALALHAPGQGMAVVAVGGDDIVVLAEDADRADRHRLLAAVLVEEAADLLVLIEHLRPLLEPADQHHLPQPAQGLVARDDRLGFGLHLRHDVRTPEWIRGPGGCRGSSGTRGGAVGHGGRGHRDPEAAPGPRQGGRLAAAGRRPQEPGDALTNIRALSTVLLERSIVRFGSRILPKNRSAVPGGPSRFQSVEAGVRRRRRGRPRTAPDGAGRDRAVCSRQDGSTCGSSGRISSVPRAIAGARRAESRRAHSTGSPAACRSGPSPGTDASTPSARSATTVTSRPPREARRRSPRPAPRSSRPPRRSGPGSRRSRRRRTGAAGCPCPTRFERWMRS